MAGLGRCAVLVVSLSLAAGSGCSSTSAAVDAGTCSACTESGSNFAACPADVATKMTVCPSPGAACCQGGRQWHCSNCAAETCFWAEACTPAGFDAGGRCSGTISCPYGQLCVSDGTCAVPCMADGGTACPSGTTCQSATSYFFPAIEAVCL